MFGTVQNQGLTDTSRFKHEIFSAGLDGVHFRWYFQDLGHPWIDWDEAKGVYRVDLEMHRHIFDFRSEVQTESEPSQYAIGIISTRKFT